MVDEQIVSTGVPRLDTVLMNGIPAGSTVLVEGSPGSGKELLAKQFAAAGVGTENVTFFSTDETSEELVQVFEKHRWPTDIRIVNVFTQYFERVLARELQASRFKQEGLSVAELTRMGAYGTPADQINFLNETVYEISKIRAPFRVVIDSLDFYLQHYKPEQVLAAMMTMKAYIQYNKGVALFTLSSNVFESKIQSYLEATCDVIFELEVARIASEFENRLIVKKVRNHPDKNAIMVYAITDHGITPEMITRIG